MPKRRFYYIVYPRDFANEYTIYAVEAGRVVEFLKRFDAQRITKPEAIRLGYLNPKRDKECFGGFIGGLGASIPETIRNAAAETDHIMGAGDENPY